MARRPQAVEIPPLSGLDRSLGNLSKQLAQALREAINSGQLKPDDLLPSSRQLAAILKLARRTVLEAYEQLIAEGFLISSQRIGTRVASIHKNFDNQRTQKNKNNFKSASLSATAHNLSKIAAQFKTLPAEPFAVSVPSGASAPDDTWRRLSNQIRSRGLGIPSGYDDPQGVKLLREAIANYVRRSRAVKCSADQVIITSGTQQGLYMSHQLLLEANDKAWVEDPAYWGITKIFESMGCYDQMVRIPIDEEGLVVSEGIKLANQARVAFVTPSHQYPLGMPMSMTRRNEILTWANQNGSWIVEDDYDSELRYAGHPFPSLQGLAPDSVIYLGTFSKILFPSLRMGYVIVPEILVNAFCGAKLLMDRHSPTADQHVLAAYINDGHLDKHIRRIRNVYADRRAYLLQLIDQWIPKELGWLQPSDQGMHLILWLNEKIDDVAFAAEALKIGVGVRAVSTMYSHNTSKPGLVLGLGGFSDDKMEAAVKKLYRIVKQMLQE